MMTVGIVLLVAIGIVVAITQLRRQSSQGLSTSSVRRFFQYLLLAGLLFAAASGLTGLLRRLMAQLLDTDATIVASSSALALNLTLTIVALPLWAGLAWWTQRRLTSEPGEVASLGWAAYLTLVGVVTVITAMVGWHGTLLMLLDRDPLAGSLPAQAVVWTLAWAGHHWWARRVHPSAGLRGQQLLGTLIGLVTAAAGLIMMLASGLRPLLGLSGSQLVGRDIHHVLEGAVVLVLGAVVWLVYWAREAARGPRDTPWLALVLLAGVGGGLVTALVALSTLGYDALVHLVGVPSQPALVDHFSSAPTQLAAAAVGALVWWYHREVLDAPGRDRERTEVRRVYEYLMSAIGLLTAAAGLTTVIVTVVEAITGRVDLLLGSNAVNTLLAALMLLTVGLPVWWWHWSQAQAARTQDPRSELASPTRRSYLLVLFGVAGVTAVIALITLVYGVLEDALEGGVQVETLRQIRIPLGILATASLLSAYHWTIFRDDRARTPAAAKPDATDVTEKPAHAIPTGLASVLLVGAVDSEGAIVQEVRSRTGAEVRLLRRTDLQGVGWSADQVLAALEHAPAGSEVLVLAEPEGLRVIPVER